MGVKKPTELDTLFTRIVDDEDEGALARLSALGGDAQPLVPRLLEALAMNDWADVVDDAPLEYRAVLVIVA